MNNEAIFIKYKTDSSGINIKEMNETLSKLPTDTDINFDLNDITNVKFMLKQYMLRSLEFEEELIESIKQIKALEEIIKEKQDRIKYLEEKLK